MRIKRLDLLAFGPFTKKYLDLSDGKPGLHVVHGPNEAGKSSTLRAFKAWLFGIEARSADNFVHDNRQLRVGGVLETSGGEEIACVRRKGNKDTLLNPDTEQPIADDTLSKLLPGLDEKLFSQLHGIDHAGLVQGGQAILEQSGDLGKSLFGAALGTQGKTDLLGALAAEADKLFKSRGQNQVINEAAVRLKQARAEEKVESVSVRVWKDLQTSLKDAEETVAKIDVEIASARRSKSKLERFTRVASTLSERRALLDRLLEFEDVLLLPEDFRSRRQAAMDKMSLASERLQKGSAKLDKVRQEAAELDVPQGMLENQEAIEELQLQLGAFQKSIRDKPAQDAKRRDHRNAAHEMLRSIRPDLDLDSVETLRPLLNRERLIAKLAQEASLLKQRTGQLDEKQRELTDEMTGLQQQQESRSEPGRDVASLRVAIQAARKAGDLARTVRNARDAVGQQEDACSRELSRLGRFDGSLDDLARCTIPERAVLEGFEKRFDELNEQVREISRHQAATSQELIEHEDSLKTLLRSSKVPSLGELHAARDHRERGWELIRIKYVNRADPGAAATEYAGTNELPGAYVEAVLAADDVGDRLRLDAQRVQERASLEAQVGAKRERLSVLEGKLRELEPARAQIENDWRAVWDGIASTVGTPKEMKEWLLRVDQLLQKAGQLDQARTQVRLLRATQTSHIEALNAEMGKLEQPQVPNAEELESLLGRCEQLASQNEAAARRQGELEAALQKLHVQLTGATQARRQADDDLQGWRVVWAEAVDGLGIGTNPHPELALSTMERLEGLFAELKEADTAHRRIYGMEKDEERFSAAVTRLVQRIALSVVEQNAAEVTQNLVKRLGKAQADAATLQELRSRISELEDEIVEARQNIELAEQGFAALRLEADVSSDEELGPVEERSNQKRLMTFRFDSLQQQLHQSGEGHSIDELEKEAGELNADQVGSDLSQLDTGLSELAIKRDATRDQRQALLVQIHALDGSSKAADAAERAEQLLAGILPDAEQYLRLTIARLILEEQIERYRLENQTPVLRRAGALFAKLTRGSFSGLRDEIDDKGKPVLLGVRQDNTEVGVDYMSDGTRDQLFLALRLATIELQGDQRDPLPFVVDDILVGFDDERSKACLEVLAEFAQKTQVLVFTHHSMVAQCARELGKEKGVFVHELTG